jgi:hypothetical protein
MTEDDRLAHLEARMNAYETALVDHLEWCQDRMERLEAIVPSVSVGGRGDVSANMPEWAMTATNLRPCGNISPTT